MQLHLHSARVKKQCSGLQQTSRKANFACNARPPVVSLAPYASNR